MDTLTRGTNKESCVCVSVRGRREVGEREREEERGRDAEFYFLVGEGKLNRRREM